MNTFLAAFALFWGANIWAQKPPVPIKPDPAVPKPLDTASETDPIAIRAGHTMRGVPLNVFLGEYSSLVKRTLITAQNLPTVTFEFKANNDLTYQEAKGFYETMLLARQIAVLPLGEKFLLVIPAPELAKTPPPFTQKTAAELPVSDVPVMVKVKLQHVMPSELVQILSNFAKSPRAIMGIDHARMLYLRDSALNVKRMLEIVEDTDVIKETHEAVISVGEASAIEIANKLNHLVDGSLTVQAPSGRTTGSTSSRTSGSSTLAQRHSQVRTRRGPFILSGTAIIACESANSLLVVAPTKAKLELAKSFVDKLKTKSK